MDNELVNPFQPTSFTCLVAGNPPPEEADVALYLLIEGSPDSSGITRRYSTLPTDSERAVVFDVENVEPGEYMCVVAAEVYSANATVNSSLYGTF